MAMEGINGKETMEANGRVTMEVNQKNPKNEKEAQVSMEVNIKDIGIEKASEINYRGWKAMPFIIGNETFEKLGALGTLANLLIYLTSVFNMKSITAATFLSVFNGTCNMATLVGAFLSDTYFGRFKTVGFATVVSFLGLLVIDLTASIPSLHPPHCGLESSSCKEATSGQLAVLYSGFALMIIGAGGIRPCNLAFGADQFNPTTESGKRGIASFFNWYNFTFTFAQLVALTLIVYIQSNVSWAIGLGIPPALMLVSCALFYMGSKIYVKVKATGSPMTSVAQVIVVAIKKRRLKHLEQPWISLFNFTPPGSINSKLSYTDQFRFLDKAAIRTPEDQTNLDGSPANPWKLCSLQQVEEVKCMVRILPIWVAAVVYYLATNTQNTYPVFQANQSDRRLGNSSFHIPAASYSVFLMLGFTIFIPIYDRILVPFLRRVTGKEHGITMLQRVGIGIVLAILSMVVSGIVEDRRRTIALTRKTIGVVPRKGAISSMSALWLVPQLFLAGISEGLGSVALMEFYYKQFPENMRSIAGSLFYLGLAGSSYLSSLLITIVHHTTRGSSTGDWLAEDLNKGRLDYYYYMIAGMEVFVFVYFLICAKWYRYKEAKSHIPEENGGLTNSDKSLA